MTPSSARSAALSATEGMSMPLGGRYEYLVGQRGLVDLAIENIVFVPSSVPAAPMRAVVEVTNIAAWCRGRDDQCVVTPPLRTQVHRKGKARRLEPAQLDASAGAASFHWGKQSFRVHICDRRCVRPQARSAEMRCGRCLSQCFCKM